MTELIAPKDYSLELIRSADELASMETAWHALLCDYAPPIPTQSHEYFSAYRSAFAIDDSQFNLVLIKQDDKLAAIIPLRVVFRRAMGVRLRVLEFVNLPMPIRDVIVAKDIELPKLLETLRMKLGTEHGLPWDYLHLRDVPAASKLIIAANPAASRLVHRISGQSNAINVSHGNHLTQVMSSNTRYNLRRSKKKLSKLGNVAMTTVTSMPGLNEAFQAFIDTEAAGWKSVSGGKNAIKLHPDQIDFYRSLMSRKSTSQGCHIHLLTLDDVPIASDYCIVEGDTVFSLKHGYDEAYSSAAPGNLLREYTIEYYEASPQIHTLDLVSNWSWHERWRPTSRTIHDVKIFNNTPVARLLYLGLRLKNALQERAEVDSDQSSVPTQG